MVDARLVIGKEYIHGTFENDEKSEIVRENYQEIIKVNQQLFERLPFEVVFTTNDPYRSMKEMRQEVENSGVLFVYTGWGGHPFFTHDENNVFRAVHDFFHLQSGGTFTLEGEYTAYLKQREHFPPSLWQTLFTEIPAYTCAYYFNNKSYNFPQRGIESPTHWLDLLKGFELPTPKESAFALE